MGANRRLAVSRTLLPVLFALGWLAGLVGQWRIGDTTGYMDVDPPLLLLGLVLFALAGAVARVDLPRFRRARAGAVAGIVALVSIVAGYLVLSVVLIPEKLGDGGDETWFSLLIESWFWIGIPLLVSGALGLLGWLAGGRLVSHRWATAH